jgi:hypothetical protein
MQLFLGFSNLCRSYIVKIYGNYQFDFRYKELLLHLLKVNVLGKDKYMNYDLLVNSLRLNILKK